MENSTIILILFVLGFYLMHQGRKERVKYRELLAKLEKEQREVARLREELKKYTEDEEEQPARPTPLTPAQRTALERILELTSEGENGVLRKRSSYLATQLNYSVKTILENGTAEFLKGTLDLIIALYVQIVLNIASFENPELLIIRKWSSEFKQQMETLYGTILFLNATLEGGMLDLDEEYIKNAETLVAIGHLPNEYLEHLDEIPDILRIAGEATENKK